MSNAKHKPRSLKHPTVLAIIKALNRICATPHVTRSDGVIDNAFGLILTFGNCGDWLDGDGWTPEAVREVTLSMALHAPPKVLEQLNTAVQAAREFVEYWDERGWIEASTLEGPERDRLYAIHGIRNVKRAA